VLLCCPRCGTNHDVVVAKTTAWDVRPVKGGSRVTVVIYLRYHCTREGVLGPDNPGTGHAGERGCNTAGKTGTAFSFCSHMPEVLAMLPTLVKQVMPTFIFGLPCPAPAPLLCATEEVLPPRTRICTTGLTGPDSACSWCRRWRSRSSSLG
jgi:hypothetical protein